MADYYGESPEVVAKEITLEAMKKVTFGGELEEARLGNYVGKLYKVILKHVREAIQEDKYE